MLVLGAILGLGVGLVVARRPADAPPAPSPPTTLASSPVDTGFLQDMVDHHRQAVELANFASAHSTNEAIRSLAFAIASSQRWEMGQMEVLLTDRGADRPDGRDRTVMAWMGAPVPLAQMPGYVPKDRMIAFLNSSGADLDRRFLELMRDHHVGGVHMAQHAADHATDPLVRDLAARMVVTQQTEINDVSQFLGS